MKRKTVVLLMSALLLVFTSSIAFAESEFLEVPFNEQEKYEINTVDELEDVIEEKSNGTGVLSESAAKKIISETEPQVVEDYVEEQTEMLRDSIDGVEFTLENSEKEEYNIVVDENTGATMKVVLQDQEEPYETSGSQNKTGTSTDATKAVGDRYFTGSCYYQSGFVAIRLFVENHYTVKSDLSLKERYLTFKEVQGFVYCDNTASKADGGHIETCSKVGSSIKYRIEVISKIGPLPELGGNLTTKYYYANSSVKLVAKNTKDKTVDVTQSLKWDF